MSLVKICSAALENFWHTKSRLTGISTLSGNPGPCQTKIALDEKSQKAIKFTERWLL
ncbi:hypothetical protein B4098_2447 [Heyndrickxia coagulans]|uniref:Uncharacterized protein n=1 Tax=Heyndrickxia coagulans TaxID=1398 RepID=A0A150JN90_HEYCO|nr:hypothetical protein B4098_2447 [Heyndrickxia coagulans]